MKTMQNEGKTSCVCSRKSSFVAGVYLYLNCRVRQRGGWGRGKVKERNNWHWINLHLHLTRVGLNLQRHILLELSQIFLFCMQVGQNAS